MVLEANNEGDNYLLPIHHNKCLGDLVLEDFDILRKGENFVRAIIYEFMSCGFRNRGVKCREDL